MDRAVHAVQGRAGVNGCYYNGLSWGPSFLMDQVGWGRGRGNTKASFAHLVPDCTWLCLVDLL